MSGLHRLSSVVSFALAIAAAHALCAAAVPGNSTALAAPSSAEAASPGARHASRWNRAAAESYVDDARGRALRACEERGIDLPKDFLAWIDRDEIVRLSVYGCRADALPVLLTLRSLEIDLGKEVVREKYTQLALAMAIHASYAGRAAKASDWNDGDTQAPDGGLPDLSPRPPLVLEIPGDPRVPVDTKDASRTLDVQDHIINFLEDHEPIEVEVSVRELPPLEYDEQGVAKPRGKAVSVTRKVTRGVVGADVIALASLQAQFNAYMQDHGHPEISLDCGDRVVHWQSTEAVDDKALRERLAAAHTLFHDAYRAKGRMPRERDAAPTLAESMAWYIRNDLHPFTEAERAQRNWPRFPLSAPWPVLMMLAADDQPLREREEIWAKFRDEGEARTYGEYIGGIAQQFDMQSARRVSPFPFSYGSIQMMWKDGGVCGTMGNIGARTHRILGTPASTVGQPGHCAVIVMEHDAASGAFRCRGEQYATGGDEVTTVHAGWNYDDVGGRRPAAWHQSIALGVNHDFEALVQSLVLRRAFDALPQDARREQALDLVRDGMSANPFAIALFEAAANATDDVEDLIEMLDLIIERLSKEPAAAKYPLYQASLRDLIHGRLAALGAPRSAAEAKPLLEALERQKCENAPLLARCWQTLEGESGFTARTTAEAKEYLQSPARQKNRKAADRFAARVKAWAKTLKGETSKKLWAQAMLEVFDGHEVLTIKDKKSVDPAVAELCRLAGRPVPEV